MTLSADEFLRRFMQHVSPKGFVKIRRYGLLANRQRGIKLTEGVPDVFTASMPGGRSIRASLLELRSTRLVCLELQPSGTRCSAVAAVSTARSHGPRQQTPSDASSRREEVERQVKKRS